MRRFTATTVWLILFLLVAGLSAGTPQWSRFRGPNGSGVSDATGLPVEFGPDHNVAWSTPVPFGRSSPIVVGDRIYLTATEDGDLVTMALDRTTGAILWRRDVPRAREDEIFVSNDSATPTPASDGANVYVLFLELGLISYDAEGTERWRMELGPFDNFYGLGWMDQHLRIDRSG